MRVGDADGFTAIVGDLDQLVDLPADEIGVHDMIDKYIPLGKRNLKQTRRRLAERIESRTAVDEKELSLLQYGKNLVNLAGNRGHF